MTEFCSVPVGVLKYSKVMYVMYYGNKITAPQLNAEWMQVYALTCWCAVLRCHVKWPFMYCAVCHMLLKIEKGKPNVLQ